MVVTRFVPLPGSLPCGRYLLASLTGNSGGSMEFMVFRARTAPTQLPTSILYTPKTRTPLSDEGDNYWAMNINAEGNPAVKGTRWSRIRPVLKFVSLIPLKRSTLWGRFGVGLNVHLSYYCD